MTTCTASIWDRFWQGPLLLSLGLTVLDQGIKLVVDNWPLAQPWQYRVIPGFFHLVHVRNPGAAWGILHGQTMLLIFISLLAVTMLLWQYNSIVEGYKERAVAIGMVLGGTFGNLIDRLHRGEVIDYLDFHLGRYHWPAFNLADAAITSGVIIFLGSSFLWRKAKAEEQGDCPGN